MYLGSFEVFKRSLAERMQVAPSELPAWAVLGSAGLGGIMYWGFIFPVDCIKSAMQTDSIIKSERKYPNMVVTAQVGWAAAVKLAQSCMLSGAGTSAVQQHIMLCC